MSWLAGWEAEQEQLLAEEQFSEKPSEIHFESWGWTECQSWHCTVNIQGDCDFPHCCVP